MTADDFDYVTYARPPIFDVASGVALAIALLSAASKSNPDHVKKALKHLHTDVVLLQTAWAKADVVAAPPDKRKADMRIDNAWAILLDRIESFASLPVTEYPKAAHAQELLAKLGGTDRAWLKLNFEAEWAESEKRLKRIDDEKLTAQIDAITGPEFLKEVHNAHKAYGVALGVTKAAAEIADVSLADPLRALSRAIVRYAVAVASTVDDDPATHTVARKALRPIDDHRAAQARRTSAGGAPDVPVTPPATPTTPIPALA